MINEAIKKLIIYGIQNDLITAEDKNYTVNRILEVLHLDEYEEPETEFININLERVLKEILDYAVEKSLIEDSIVYRDLLDTKIMGCLVPPPHDVVTWFDELYSHSPVSATDWFYKFSQDTDYIRRYRVKKDLRWKVQTEYGELDLSINLSKPEKDPKAIAAAKNAKQSSYPKCMLCAENEGFSGRVNHPARQNHRIIPIEIDNEQWYFQYSPYVYYNEHCILLNSKHIPMIINAGTFRKLFDFVKKFPHYFVGSNADLPIVGGSILSHDHFQGGNYEFGMARAEVEKYYKVKGFDDIETGIVKWPMSVIRIRHKESEKLVEFADYILSKWRNYSDEAVFIFSETDGEPHNTITPIARKKDDVYELDLVLRNNITTEEHPLGVYHPHKELHHIKKENIGLIEVMGLAVLPSRLDKELKLLAEYILAGKNIRENELIEKHADWAEKFLPKYGDISESNIMGILEQEAGLVFVKVLEDAGVFKRTQQGQEAFDRFLKTL